MNSIEGNTLPKGWVKRKLGEVFKDISSGFACSKRFEKDGGYVHLRTHNISTQGVLNFDKIIQIEESKVNRKSSKIYKGDVIFNNTNSTELVGKTSFVDKDYNYGFSNHLTRIKTSDFSQGKYLTYFLTHLHQQGHFFRICKKWIGQSGVNISMLKDLNYYYPPLEEQKRIVAKIDTLFAKIDKAISLTEESLVQAKNLLPSVLKEVFEKGKADGWEEKKLVDLKESNIIGLVRNAKQQSIDFSFEYVKMNNVTNDNRFTFNNITCVEANEKELQKFKLAKGDFLFNTRNSFELVGKSCIYDSDKENVLYNNNLMRIRFKNGINPYFILYQFSSPFLISQLRNIKSGTTSVCAIYYQSLKDILLLVSSSDTQDKLVTYFNDVSKQAQQTQSKLKEQLAYLKQLKSSILSKAFKGEL